MSLHEITIVNRFEFPSSFPMSRMNDERVRRTIWMEMDTVRFQLIKCFSSAIGMSREHKGYNNYSENWRSGKWCAHSKTISQFFLLINLLQIYYIVDWRDWFEKSEIGWLYRGTKCRNVFRLLNISTILLMTLIRCKCQKRTWKSGTAELSTVVRSREKKHNQREDLQCRRSFFFSLYS